MNSISSNPISRKGKKKSIGKMEVQKWRQKMLAKKEERTGVCLYPTLLQTGIWKSNTLVFVDTC